VTPFDKLDAGPWTFGVSKDRLYFVARHSQKVDYAVYPADFPERGFCWTFRTVTKARSKAKSLGVGSWIRRLVYASDKDTGNNEFRDFRVDGLWRWTGVGFVRMRVEPKMYPLSPFLTNLLAERDRPLSG
jgi:hypothetical protein